MLLNHFHSFLAPKASTFQLILCLWMLPKKAPPYAQSLYKGKIDFKWRKDNKSSTTLALLDVAVGVLSPRLWNANIGIHFLHASMQVDVSWRITHLVTSVVWNWK